MKRLVLPLPGNEAFAAALVRACSGERGGIETRRFPEGESYVRLHGDPYGRPVDLVCMLGRPDAQYLPLVFAADAPARAQRPLAMHPDEGTGAGMTGVGRS